MKWWCLRRPIWQTAFWRVGVSWAWAAQSTRAVVSNPTPYSQQAQSCSPTLILNKTSSMQAIPPNMSGTSLFWRGTPLTTITKSCCSSLMFIKITPIKPSGNIQINRIINSPCKEYQKSKKCISYFIIQLIIFSSITKFILHINII